MKERTHGIGQCCRHGLGGAAGDELVVLLDPAAGELAHQVSTPGPQTSGQYSSA